MSEEKGVASAPVTETTTETTEQALDVEKLLTEPYSPVGEEPDEQSAQEIEDNTPETPTSEVAQEPNETKVQENVEVAELKKQNELLINKLERFGGVDNVSSVMQHLVNNPELLQHVKDYRPGQNQSRQQQEANYTPDELEALKFIDDRISDKINKAVDKYVTPMNQHIKQQKDINRQYNIKSAFKQMDSKYPGWDKGSYKSDIEALAQSMESKHPGYLNNPDFDTIESLYLTVKGRRGDIDTTSIEQREQMSTAPIRNSVKSVANNKITSLRDAARLAEQQLGRTFEPF